MHEEGAAADAARLRLGQTKHDLHRNGGVGGAAAPAKDAQPGFDGHGVGGGDDGYAWAAMMTATTTMTTSKTRTLSMATDMTMGVAMATAMCVVVIF